LVSKDEVPACTIDSAHWHYSSLKYFPETAIFADTSKQNFAIYPRKIYVDIEEMCEIYGLLSSMHKSRNIGLKT